MAHKMKCIETLCFCNGIDTFSLGFDNRKEIKYLINSELYLKYIRNLIRLNLNNNMFFR